MELTRATSDDVDALVECWLALAADQRRHGSHVQGPENRAVVADALARHVVMEELWVARESEIVGFVTYTLREGRYSRTERVGVVTNLYVRPAARNRSVGSRLLEAAETDLRERGADTVSLEVLADNEAARRFYRRHGYDPHRLELSKAVENDTHSKDHGER